MTNKLLEEILESFTRVEKASFKSKFLDMDDPDFISELMAKNDGSKINRNGSIQEEGLALSYTVNHSDTEVFVVSSKILPYFYTYFTKGDEVAGIVQWLVSQGLKYIPESELSLLWNEAKPKGYETEEIGLSNIKTVWDLLFYHEG